MMSEKEQSQKLAQPEQVEPTDKSVSVPIPASDSIRTERLRAAAKIVPGVAWPATALILAVILIHYLPDILGDLTKAAKDTHGVIKHIGKDGITYEDYQEGVHQAAQAAAGVLAQGAAPDENGKLPAPIGPVEANRISRAVANSVVDIRVRAAVGLPQPKKILWVDDHPSNNTGLRTAFEAVGIRVVDVERNEEIAEAFRRESKFDVVITDMARDQPRDPDAGLKTIDIIRRDHPGVPVIVYSAGYAAAHRNDTLPPPVISITNSPDAVFRLITTGQLGPSSVGS